MTNATIISVPSGFNDQPTRGAVEARDDQALIGFRSKASIQLRATRGRRLRPTSSSASHLHHSIERCDRRLRWSYAKFVCRFCRCCTTTEHPSSKHWSRLVWRRT